MKRTEGKTRLNNLVFVVVDCARADAFIGNKSLPFISGLCKKSLVCSNAVSVCSTTIPCFSSILTGLYSFGHGVKTMLGHKMKEDVKTLPEALKEKGYYTVAEMSGPIVKGIGLEKGFDEFNIRDKHDLIYFEFGDYLLKKLQSLPQPFFLFLHLWELHRPRYLLRKHNKPRFGKTAYWRTLHSLDESLERFYKTLPKNTTLVLMGDHGEIVPKNKLEEYKNHLEYGLYYLGRMLELTDKYPSCEGHGHNVSEQSIRIPLIVNDKRFDAKEIKKQVSEVDLAPTLAKLLGLPKFNKFHGHDLLEEKHWPVFIETVGVKAWLRGESVEGIRDGSWKYTKRKKDGKETLYFIDGKKDVLENNQAKLEEMRKKFSELKKQEVEEKMVDAKTKEKLYKSLQRLGYL